MNLSDVVDRAHERPARLPVNPEVIQQSLAGAELVGSVGRLFRPDETGRARSPGTGGRAAELGCDLLGLELGREDDKHAELTPHGAILADVLRQAGFHWDSRHPAQRKANRRAVAAQLGVLVYDAHLPEQKAVHVLTLAVSELLDRDNGRDKSRLTADLVRGGLWADQIRRASVVMGVAA